MRLRPALAAPATVAALVLSTSLSAAAEPAVAEPAPPPGAYRPGAPVAPPPLMERRSTVAVSAGSAAVVVGSILLVSSAFSGGLQASCDGTCHHGSTVIGLIVAGSTLIAVGIPLIVWGARMVPVQGTSPAVAIVPRKPLPRWIGPSASGGLALRF